MAQDYFRPRGDITTVLDQTDRDAQDNTYFPLDTEGTFFHRGKPLEPEENEKPFTVYPTTMSIQEFPQRGPAHWGQTLSFELGSLKAGDLLQGITVQIKLGSWYDDAILAGLKQQRITASVSETLPLGGALPAASNGPVTAVLTQTVAASQPIPISTMTIVLWDIVDTTHSIGTTDLVYYEGLFTNPTQQPITVLVEYSLYLSQATNGSSFIGVNLGVSDMPSEYTTYSVVSLSDNNQLTNSCTITLQPNDVLGIYYMDNDFVEIGTASSVSFIIETESAETYPLPTEPSACVPVGDSIDYSADYWTYCNSLGTSIIEYADFIVKDQTVERLTGEFIRTFFNATADANQFACNELVGAVPYRNLSNMMVAETPFAARRPYPTEDGTYFCVLPFFFFRTKLAEIFPLLACNEGQVRIDIKLRPFEQMVRRYVGWRREPCDTPLQKVVPFLSVPIPLVDGAPDREQACLVAATTASQPPPFRDFRLVTACSYTTGSLREKFLHQPFEQMVKLVQTFSFDEPLKYVLNKTSADGIEIRLPLELNHPVVELLWVFRRKAVQINNEWSNFGPAVGFQLAPAKVYPPWLQHATLRVNGSEVISAEGEWFRQHIAGRHSGGWSTYQSHLYGYSFAERPETHQPSGTANMSRASSVTLQLRVSPPLHTVLPDGCNFDPTIMNGWEVFVFAMHYNWLRFENGICGRMFQD